MIEVRDVRKSYDKVEILHGLSFDIKKGRVHAFLGRNGAGKTSFIRGFMDVFKFDSGTITIDGKPFDPKDYKMGYLPEERGMYQKVPILDQLLYFSSLRGIDEKKAKDNIMDLLTRLGLGDKAKDKLMTLSKGNQQKVQLIQALMNEPDIIILDEPFSGLDPVNSEILMDLVKDIMTEDTYMIFSSHQMSYVEDICQDITMIDHGSIVLDGEIEGIKREMGSERLRIQAPDETYESLKKAGYRLEDLGNKLIIDPEDRTKEELLALMVKEGLSFDSLGDYLPSLSEIYIETVGD